MAQLMCCAYPLRAFVILALAEACLRFTLLLLLLLLLLPLQTLFLERLALCFALWWSPSLTCSHDSRWCPLFLHVANTWTLEFTAARTLLRLDSRTLAVIAAWLMQFLGLDSRTPLGLDFRTLEVTAAGTDWRPWPWSFGR